MFMNHITIFIPINKHLYYIYSINSGKPARKQAKYHIEAVASSLDADPITLRALHRKYKQFSPRPIKEPNVFYGVRLGHVPGVFTSWKEAQPHTIGIRSDFKQFKTRQKAEAYVAQPVTLNRPRSPPRTRFFIRTALPRSRRVPLGGECT